MPATLTIVPWSDPHLEAAGHDPRSRYVETFWLPTLGPTAVLLLRHLADRFDTTPGGIELTVSSTSQALGLGRGDGVSSPVVRSLARLTQFDLACDDNRGTIAVRRRIPPINPRHVRRLPEALRAEHARWAEEQLEHGPLEAARGHARRMANALVEQGEDPGRIERVLHAAGFHPTVASEAVRGARAHRRAEIAG